MLHNLEKTTYENPAVLEGKAGDTDLVAAVGWNLSSELYSCSDDHTIWKWNRNGEALSKVCVIETSFTDIQWYPSMSQCQRSGPGNDVFVVACTDGSFHIISKGGREEKQVEAHEGAIICLRWNFEGTALVTGGEDGIVKIWSRNGMLRSTLAETEHSIYGVAWGPDSDQVLFTHGSSLVIKHIQSGSKEMQWESHCGLVLAVDWSPVNNYIVSAGEDCRYKWLYAKEKPNCGILFRLAWSTDGTQIAGATGRGCVIFGQLVDRQVEWTSIIVTLEDANRIRVQATKNVFKTICDLNNQDVLNETVEELGFRDRVIKMSLGFDHLVVATSTQCCIYSATNWNIPHTFDVKDTIILLKLCHRYFLMVDCATGLSLFTYEGRHLCNPKYQGLRAEALNDQNVSLSDDILAITDTSNCKTVHFLDANRGKLVGDALQHTLEIVEISLNQMGSYSERKLVFIDKNGDLYITPVLKIVVFKLGAMVNDAIWNHNIDILAAISDQKLVVWYYPQAMYVDKDLLKYIKLPKECLIGESAKILGFWGSRCTIRRKDGATIFTDISPYPFSLFEHVRVKQWDQAIRLCRFVKENLLWACLAAMAVDSKELSIAEVAYAALDEVDKVHYILHVKDLPSEEARQAELALFRRKPEEAESILLQAGLTYRAIKMNVRLFKWDRALELALLYKVHLDTVLWLRQQHLESKKHIETKPEFLQLGQRMQIDVEKILEKIGQEKERESRRPSIGHQIGRRQAHTVTLSKGSNHCIR